MSVKSSSGLFTRVGEILKDDSNRSSLLLLPVTVFELVFFVVPMLYLLRISLYEQTSQGAFKEGTWTLSTYADVITSGYIQDLMWFTFKFAIISTAISVAIGVFYAYAIWRAEQKLRMLLLFGVVLPLLTTLVVKLYAGVLLLSPGGAINEVLISTGIRSEPIQLMNNFLGVLIGQLYITVPYSVLAIYSVLSTMDWEIVEAARDLGANRVRSFYEVVLPEIVPGIAVASVISFAWGIGAYSSPAILGTARQTTFALEVESLMLSEFNWPAAAALSLIMLLVVLVSIIVLFRFLDSRGGETDYV
ncbi:ABC transporter permease [Natrinema halophilum]|uniref:ABC transporter permease n=1 Tax=Natrinema halophilum TaxID=1699371 RepID=A0A7D5KEH8_9EURY|nr:ABC transporter permease [Natrinema halophilum]QLG50201.1 ABC transporter permease [Natrinema halophilum]